MAHRKGTILAVAMAGCLALALFSGCSAETQQWILTTFFDVPDTPPPPTRRVRQDLLREIEELKRELAEARGAAKAIKEQAPAEKAELPIERAKTWPEALALLPKDQAGSVDWAQALKVGTIAPRPGIEPKASDQPVLPITVERTPPGQDAFKVLFPHEPHTQWLACDNCHPALFQMSKGATPINMGLIYAGQACGVCHGKVAFPVTACGRCHPAMAGGK
jgi:c(7)-type cytochrome triheme protein